MEVRKHAPDAYSSRQITAALGEPESPSFITAMPRLPQKGKGGTAFMSMIRVENLSFSYSSSYDPVFEHVSFTIDLFPLLWG